jgi:C-terminal processing protease CtpA/Prc
MQSFFSNVWLEEDRILYIRIDRCMSAEMALEQGDTALAMQFPPFRPFADSLFAFLERTPEARLLIDLRFNPEGAPQDGYRLIERIAENPTLNQGKKVFVAVNLYTSAGALAVAARFKRDTRATLIGEIPGGRPNISVRKGSFSLPNTKLRVLFSTDTEKILKGNPDTLRPDIPVTLPYADFKAGKDPLLDFIRNTQ